jgi:cellulose synthase/poly-beta-1,6-N-acetylglucosamine synthase-like glycosyltransferase
MLFVFAVSAFAQISFWIALWIGIGRVSKSRPLNHQKPDRLLSVVVAVKDGVETLPTLLPALSAQQHSDFEVIVVDDESRDDSLGLVTRYIENDPRFKIVSNPRHRRGKKGAVSTGIDAARGRLIILTDADCRPGSRWLSAVDQAHNSEGLIVVGYGPYARRSSGINLLVRFETLATAIMTAGSIGLGRPYMAVGRNLSYPKTIVDRLAETTRGTTLLSGDDDLLVQAASDSGVSVRYLMDPDSFVVSDAPESVGDWTRQKRRHLSASRSYRMTTVLGLTAFHGSSLVCWLAPLLLGWPGALYLAAKFAVQWPITVAAAKKFNENGLVPYLPVLDLAWLTTLVVLTPAAILSPPKKW